MNFLNLPSACTVSIGPYESGLVDVGKVHPSRPPEVIFTREVKKSKGWSLSRNVLKGFNVLVKGTFSMVSSDIEVLRLLSGDHFELFDDNVTNTRSVRGGDPFSLTSMMLRFSKPVDGKAFSLTLYSVTIDGEITFRFPMKPDEGLVPLDISFLGRADDSRPDGSRIFRIVDGRFNDG